MVPIKRRTNASAVKFLSAKGGDTVKRETKTLNKRGNNGQESEFTFTSPVG